MSNLKANKKSRKQKQKQTCGLFIDEEFNKAVERCKVKVESIAKDHRRKNRKFRDLEFDFDSWDDRASCLYGANYDKENVEFNPSATRRVSDLFENPQFYVEGAGYSDIAQGSLGDCWFLSGMAAVATKPGLLEKLCVARDEKVGIYGFVFCRDGEWTDVIIDDQLFTSAPVWEALDSTQKPLFQGNRDLYEKNARKGGETLYFARSIQENETWVPLFEKAFAKLHGDYQSLVGGQTPEAIEDLTGGIAESIYISDIIDKDEFWEKELQRAKHDLLFSCAIDNPPGVEVFDNQVKGIYTQHAYTILSAVEFRGKKFLKVRNPWGSSEWTGRWSDGSKEWTEEWLEALSVLEHKFGDDGVFIMEYCDFLTHFTSVERTQLFDNSWVRSSHWLNVRTRKIPAAWQHGDVSFSFTLPEGSETIMALSQSDTRYYQSLESAASWSFDFTLFKVGEEEPIGSSDYSTGLTRSVTMRNHLEPGQYVVHVRLSREYDADQNIALKIPTWNTAKASKVLSQYAQSRSIAANFDPKPLQRSLITPVEKFAGQDLLTVLNKYTVVNALERKVKSELIKDFGSAVKEDEKELGQYPLSEGGERGGDEETGQGDDGEGEGADSAEGENQGEGSEAGGGEGNDAGSNASDSGSNKGGDEGFPVPPTALNPDPTAAGAFCNLCKNDIAGVRWKCAVCIDYDLCDNCKKALMHDQHPMLKIEDAEDFLRIQDTEFEDDIGLVLLGFRVFSKKNAPAAIIGHIADGQGIPWTRDD